MNDLIQRLRAHYPFAGLPREAADRIEALEAALRNVLAAHAEGGQCSEQTMAEIARAALAPEQDK